MHVSVPSVRHATVRDFASTGAHEHAGGTCGRAQGFSNDYRPVAIGVELCVSALFLCKPGQGVQVEPRCGPNGWAYAVGWYVEERAPRKWNSGACGIVPWFVSEGRVMLVLTARAAIAPQQRRAAGGKHRGAAVGVKPHVGGMGARAGRSARRAAERALAAAERAQAPVPADAFADASADAEIEELVVPSPVADAATGVAAAPAADAPADASAAEVSLLSQTLQVLLPALPLHVLFQAASESIPEFITKHTVGCVSLYYISHALLARGLLLVERVRVLVRWRRLNAADPAAGRACPDGRAGSACPDGRTLLSAFGFFFSLLARHLPTQGALHEWLYASHGPVRDFGRLGARAKRRALERAITRVRDKELERYAWDGLHSLSDAFFYLERIPERGDEGDWDADGSWVPDGCPVDVSARVTIDGSRRKPRCVLVLNVCRFGNDKRHHTDTRPRPPLAGGRRHLHLLVRGVSAAGIQARGSQAEFWHADVENFGAYFNSYFNLRSSTTDDATDDMELDGATDGAA
ncbi:hypothetical protein T492DRAFT_867415 [Pavlovales sp. CCMP2436]|nr:hypothetical protein T492DRAFT_867415 [Pavlovales sp. CCMP2436]